MPYYYGDFYPLIKINRENDSWVAWQFDRPEQDDGIVQAFRRKDSLYESARLKLRGLDPKAIYQIVRIGGKEKEEATGEELMNKGLLVSLTEWPEAAVFQYHRVP